MFLSQFIEFFHFRPIKVQVFRPGEAKGHYSGYYVPLITSLAVSAVYGPFGSCCLSQDVRGCVVASFIIVHGWYNIVVCRLHDDDDDGNIYFYNNNNNYILYIM